LPESYSDELANEKLMELEIQKPAEECLQPDKEASQDIYCQVFGSGKNLGNLWRNGSRHNQFRQSIKNDVWYSHEDKKVYLHAALKKLNFFWIFKLISFT